MNRRCHIQLTNMSCINLLPRLLQIAKGEGWQHESVSIDVPCQLRLIIICHPRYHQIIWNSVAMNDSVTFGPLVSL